MDVLCARNPTETVVRAVHSGSNSGNNKTTSSTTTSCSTTANNIEKITYLLNELYPSITTNGMPPTITQSRRTKTFPPFITETVQTKPFPIRGESYE